MKERNLLRSGVVTLMLLLVASMSFVPAVSVADAAGSVEDGNENSCSACGGCSDANVTVVELEGAEKNRAVAEALANDEVRKLRAKLIEVGYTPKVSEATAEILQIGEAEVLMVQLPFKGDADESKIIYTKLIEDTSAISIIYSEYEEYYEGWIYRVDEDGKVTEQYLKLRKGGSCVSCSSDADCDEGEACANICVDWDTWCIITCGAECALAVSCCLGGNILCCAAATVLCANCANCCEAWDWCCVATE